MLDEVLVDLREGAVEHLTAFKHVENAVREDGQTVTCPIDFEEVLVGSHACVDHELEARDVEGQSERLFLKCLVPLKICDHRVLRLRLVLDRKRDVGLL